MFYGKPFSALTIYGVTTLSLPKPVAEDGFSKASSEANFTTLSGIQPTEYRAHPNLVRNSHHMKGVSDFGGKKHAITLL
jgi:hypothetical protein